MLPGFRFLFAAIVLSISVLIFGLGAAAWLRAAHEEFTTLPSRRAPPEPFFARLNDDPMPTLALLRVDPPVMEETKDHVEADAAIPAIVIPAEQASDAPPAEPEEVAALKPEEPVQAEAPTPEIPAAEATAETPTATAETSAAAAEADVNLAAITETPAAPPAAPPLQPEPATDMLSLDAHVAATRSATFGVPAVIVDDRASATTSDVQPDRSAARKRAAQRARERRRIARRARLAREAALAQQQLLQQTNNPFAQLPIARTIR